MSDVARASLRHLSLELSTETPLRAYEFLKKTQNLDSLNVHVCPPVFGVEHDPMKESERLMTVILRCPGLRTLRTFTHTGYDSLFRNVTHLSHFLSRTPDLDRLSMILPNQLGALESRSLIFPSTRALRYATIISPKFDGTLRALLAAISKSIESLELLVNHAITDPKAARSALYSLGPRLKYLSFHANIPPADYRFLDSLPFHLHGLRGLYLSRGTCTSALFENLHHAKKLRYLGLAGCLPDVVKEDKVIEFLQAIGSRSVTPVGEFECACDDGSTTQRTRSLKRRFRRLVLFPLVNQATDPPIPLDSPLFDTCRSAGVRLKLETSLPAQFSDVGQVNCRQTEPIWH
ncbi:hypothetical protein VNI00_000687 [Paramarasmius palmivorus]|uniref:Uncharacterized protein n=1 Tax=Paramarasmius palmivorus TaxID=297713 RepID=A0AAW0EBX1_9AGAR